MVVVGLAMVYVVGGPVRAIMEGLTAILQGMGTTNAVLLGLLLGLLLGGMMAVDMGGPVSHLGWYALAIVVSTVVTAVALIIVKRPLDRPQAARHLIAAQGSTQ